MIQEDCVIDKSQLDNESLKTPTLHGKWYGIYLEEKRYLRAMEVEFKKLKKMKYDYYLGRCEDSVYEEEPLPLKITRADLDIYLDADETTQSFYNKIVIQQDKCDMIKTFIDRVLNQRSFHIRTALDFIKWSNGG
jgi:hypothetical protein